jgi:hypothetical protein
MNQTETAKPTRNFLFRVVFCLQSSNTSAAEPGNIVLHSGGTEAEEEGIGFSALSRIAFNVLRDGIKRTFGFCLDCANNAVEFIRR